MRDFFYQDDQVARNTAAWGCVALTAHAQLHAFAYTGRYIDADRFFVAGYAFSMANRAFRSDHRAFAITGRAGAGGLHLAQDSVRYPANRALSAAGFTGLYR